MWRRRGERWRWTQQWLGRLLAALAGLGLVAVLALGVAIVANDGWPGLSAARLSVGATALAFVAACFSAFAGLRSADAGRQSAEAADRSANAGRDSAAAAQNTYGQHVYELARSLHADLTTGEVGQARDRLGTVSRLYSEWFDDPAPVSFRGHVDLHLPPRDRSVEQRVAEVRRDWFTLLWCFQRIRAADELLEHAPSASAGFDHPHRFLRRLIASQVRFLIAIVGPPEPLQRRLASGVPPLLNELDAGVAAAASATVPRSVEALAKELGWPPAVVAARMTGLLRAGAISEPSPGRYRRDPALGPIGRIYAIEAKVRDGGAALRQVRAYTTWADAYVIVTGAMGETARSRLEPEVHRDGGGLVVAGRWRQRPRLRPTSRARRLRSAEHIVAALDPAMVG